MQRTDEREAFSGKFMYCADEEMLEDDDKTGHDGDDLQDDDEGLEYVSRLEWFKHLMEDVAPEGSEAVKQRVRG
jgi:hypothetical protein